MSGIICAVRGGPARDDRLSITIQPWLALTGFSITRQPQYDTIPLIACGKVHQDAEISLLPVFVNSHHALVDSLHIARDVKYIEEEAQNFASSTK